MGKYHYFNLHILSLDIASNFCKMVNDVTTLESTKIFFTSLALLNLKTKMIKYWLLPIRYCPHTICCFTGRMGHSALRKPRSSQQVVSFENFSKMKYPGFKMIFTALKNLKCTTLNVHYIGITNINFLFSHHPPVCWWNDMQMFSEITKTLPCLILFSS